MSLSTAWFHLALPERKGTWRGMEVGMPLRDALDLEQGDLTRGSETVTVHGESSDDALHAVELRFARLKGVDRVVSVRFTLSSPRHFADVEQAYQLVVAGLTRQYGPPFPPEPTRATRGRALRTVWKVQGRQMPTRLVVEYTDAMDESAVRLACLTVEMARAAGA